ncbi:MAG: hypothetical protein RLZZ440_2576 [Planctomycetota bacterium]|jgi:hypothetical protein
MRSRRLLVARSFLLVTALAGLPSGGFAQSYSPILDSTEDQTAQGVRGTAGSSALLACSYTPAGASAPQGMWWEGDLATNTGTAYQINPVIGSQVVTSALYYGPDTFEFNPTLGAGNIQIVGSYQYTGSTQDNNGVLYTGPLDGSGTWTQINVPDAVTGGTVANTVPHSVMGSIAVGNYNLNVGGSAVLGNAFLYNVTTQGWTIFDTPFGGTDKLTSAYGIWQNGVGSTSYTIAGGSAADGGVNKAFLIDYDSQSDTFSNLTYFTGGALTHFEGITGSPNGYNLVGVAGTSYLFATVDRIPGGGFGPATWTGPLSYPGASTTTGNTVIGDQVLGIYQLPNDATVYAYVATVPEPAGLIGALAALGCGGWLLRRRIGG